MQQLWPGDIVARAPELTDSHKFALRMLIPGKWCSAASPGVRAHFWQVLWVAHPGLVERRDHDRPSFRLTAEGERLRTEDIIERWALGNEDRRTDGLDPLPHPMEDIPE